MQTVTVDALPQCTDCVAEEKAEPNHAEFDVITPTKQRAKLCFDHFLTYVEFRLGTNTVKRIVMVQKSGGGGRGRQAA